MRGGSTLEESHASSGDGLTDLSTLVEEAFREAYGNEIIGIACRPMMPHEAFVEIRVRQQKAGMVDLTKALTEELEELGRKITIRIVAQPPGK